MNRNILLLADGNNNIWELVRRVDLKVDSITEETMSILNKEFENFIFTDKLINVEIKDNYDDNYESNNDITKINYLNYSGLIKD